MSGTTLPAMGGCRTHSSRYHLTTAVLLGLTAAIVARLLARRALHGFDAFLALRAAITGEDQSTGTLLYVPLARGAGWVLQSIVPDAFAVLQLLSALGLGLAVAFVYLAATRLRLRSPTLVALSLLSLPAATYFGATVEVDALLLGGSSIAWWASIPFARRPLPTRAMRLGSITGITASFHGGGQLLFVAILTVTGMHVFRRCRRQRSARPARRWLAASAIAGTCHAAIYLTAVLLCAHEGQLAMAANTLALAPHWDRLPTTLWQEWLVPYSPHCLLWLLAGLDPRLRWCSFGFGIVVCVYLWITNAVLAHFEPGRAEIHEQGAFFVTIAAPTVLFGVARLSVAGLRVAVLLGLPFAIAFTRLGDWQPEPPGFGAAVEDFDRNHRAWTLCDEPATDYGWIRKRAGAVPVLCVWEIERELTLYHDAGIAIDGDRLGHWLDAQFTRIEHLGRCMLITERAREAMNHHSDSRLRTLIHDWVPAHFRLDAIQLGPFEAVQLHRR